MHAMCVCACFKTEQLLCACTGLLHGMASIAARAKVEQQVSHAIAEA